MYNELLNFLQLLQFRSSLAGFLLYFKKNSWKFVKIKDQGVLKLFKFTTIVCVLCLVSMVSKISLPMKLWLN